MILSLLPAGVAMFLVVSMAILTTRALPLWLGWLAVAASVVLLMIWVLAASVVLLIRPGRQPTTGP